MNTERNLSNNPEQAWQAVINRDPSADGSLFYGVRSTGIYCRPSCPSRRPRRELVTFYPSADSAREAGFRSCLRCKPDESSAMQMAIVSACRYIELHHEDAITLRELSRLTEISPSHFQRTFKRIVGVSPREYADACRLRNLKNCLKLGEPVGEALIDSGYGSTSRLYERSNTQLGMTPTKYKRKGEVMTIQFTIAQSSLGWLLVGATEKGICTVALGDTEAELNGAIKEEFPAANLMRNDPNLEASVRKIIDHIEGIVPSLDLPTDVRATAFQRQVWQELQRIPYGQTRSYREVAEAIGRPTAARAVARACATNPTALIVPCHRVVRGNGDLSGYRWGVERKRNLLARENR